jgi:ATP/maltotriose-dependent transcriptional regulator MalT
MDAANALSAGHAALARGDWQGAREAFSVATSLTPSAEAYEGLGKACWWLNDQAAVFEAREQAFRLYREAGDARGAGRIATLIGFDYADYRGDLAVCNGWLQRAETLLKDEPPCPEQAWLYVYQGFIVLMFEDDIQKSTERIDQVETHLPALKSIDLEMMTVGLRGLLAIRQGDISGGLRLFDEAMTAALDGEMTDLVAVGNLSCTLIYACEAIADYDRARQWCERTREFCKRMGLDTVFSICRTYYATTLIWRGEWEAADTELSAAMHELEPNRPSYVQDSLARLGELRRRQGRLEEAGVLFAQAGPHRTALFGRASMAFDRGDMMEAVDLLSRVLRRIGVEDRAERVFVLALLARAKAAVGEIDVAGGLLNEMDDLSRLVGTRPLAATVLATRGFFAATAADWPAAQACFEDALDLFEAAGARFESAGARLDLAHVLQAQSRRAAATEQAMIAQTAFGALGARGGAEKSAALLSGLAGGIAAPTASTLLPNGITPREGEVLWLIAAGRTNQEIADDLVLSVRTVERHISTIYEKLGLHGRSARASAAAVAVQLRSHT